MPMPPWVEAVLKLGVPGAIAVFLVWRLAAGFDVLAARMTALEQGHAEQNAHSLRDEDMSGRLYLVQEKMLRVLTADCVNHADSAEGRRACVQ